ncbi:DMT family transporter [Psychromonas sp. PT13]|uniref:DMT family transporter n=1 Tax=Psychromonas sp. PT13 TaxID=3439547 RepID=UPI003EB80C1D
MPASLCLIIATFLWGSSFVALKYTVNIYDPIFVVFSRMLITLMTSLLLWRWVKRFEYRAGDWKYLLTMSLAEPCLYYLFEGYALQNTSASQAGVLVSSLPLIVAVLAFYLLKENLSKAIIVGFGLCITGGLLLTYVSPNSTDATNPVLGNFLEFLAMICAAFYSVSLKRLTVRYSPLSLIALQGLSGTLFFAPFLFFTGLPEVHHSDALWGILYLGTFVTLGGYGCYNYALSKVSVLTAAAYSNLIPVFSLLLSAILLGEILNVNQWISIFIIFAGVIVSQFHTTKKVLNDPVDIKVGEV